VEIKKVDVETLPNTKRKEYFNSFMEGGCMSSEQLELIGITAK
jgi:hypothetical protein